MWEKRRKAERIAVAESVSASWTNGGAHAISGISRDLSTSGAFFYCERAPELGSEIELLVTLPPKLAGGDTANVLCRGRVVRVEPSGDDLRVGVAVEFESVEKIPSS
jgi:PilZ domain-containing protein